MKARLTLMLVVALGVFVFLPATTKAQEISQTGVDLSVSNDNPAPGDSLVVTARSYSTDINVSTVTWMVGGRTVQKGTGLTTYTVKAPALGKTAIIDVLVTTPDGLNFENSIGITSGLIDLIVEPAGYVPAFFPGKSPVVYQNSIKIAAIPHLANSSGVEYDPKSLVYRWQRGTEVLEDQSGYGKQSVVVKGALVPRPFVIKVSVSSRDGAAVSSKSTTVSASSPFIGFYRNDPIYGPLYNKAITGPVILGGEREAGVVAVPYGFTMPKDGLGDLTFAWAVNGKSRPELDKNRTITLRAPAGQAGTSGVSLRITNTKDILQSASGSFNVTFSASATTSSSISF